MEDSLTCYVGPQQELVNLNAEIGLQNSMTNYNDDCNDKTQNEESDFIIAGKKLKSIVPRRQVDVAEALPETARATDTEVVCTPRSEEPALFVRRPYKTSPVRGSRSKQLNTLMSPEYNNNNCLVNSDTNIERPLFIRRSHRRSPGPPGHSLAHERKESSSQGPDMNQDFKELNTTLKVPYKGLDSLISEHILSNINCSDSDINIDTSRRLQSQVLDIFKQKIMSNSFKNNEESSRKTVEVYEGNLSDNENVTIENIYCDSNASEIIGFKILERKTLVLLVINYDKEKVGKINDQTLNTTPGITDFEAYTDNSTASKMKDLSDKTQALAIPKGITRPLHQPKITKASAHEIVSKKRISLENYKQKLTNIKQQSSLKDDNLTKERLKLTEKEHTKQYHSSQNTRISNSTLRKSTRNHYNRDPRRKLRDYYTNSTKIDYISNRSTRNKPQDPRMCHEIDVKSTSSRHYRIPKIKGAVKEKEVEKTSQNKSDVEKKESFKNVKKVDNSNTHLMKRAENKPVTSKSDNGDKRHEVESSCKNIATKVDKLKSKEDKSLSRSKIPDNVPNHDKNTQSVNIISDSSKRRKRMSELKGETPSKRIRNTSPVTKLRSIKKPVAYDYDSDTPQNESKNRNMKKSPKNYLKIDQERKIEKDSKTRNDESTLMEISNFTNKDAITIDNTSRVDDSILSESETSISRTINTLIGNLDRDIGASCDFNDYNVNNIVEQSSSNNSPSSINGDHIDFSSDVTLHDQVGFIIRLTNCEQIKNSEAELSNYLQRSSNDTISCDSTSNLNITNTNVNDDLQKSIPYNTDELTDNMTINSTNSSNDFLIDIVDKIANLNLTENQLPTHITLENKNISDGVVQKTTDCNVGHEAKENETEIIQISEVNVRENKLTDTLSAEFKSGKKNEEKPKIKKRRQRTAAKNYLLNKDKQITRSQAKSFQPVLLEIPPKPKKPSRELIKLQQDIPYIFTSEEITNHSLGMRRCRLAKLADNKNSKDKTPTVEGEPESTLVLKSNKNKMPSDDSVKSIKNKNKRKTKSKPNTLKNNLVCSQSKQEPKYKPMSKTKNQDGPYILSRSTKETLEPNEGPVPNLQPPIIDDVENASGLTDSASSTGVLECPHFKIKSIGPGTKQYVCCINGLDNHFKTELLKSIRKHVQFKHSENWDGYCSVCKVIVAGQGKHTFNECLQHFLVKHVDDFPIIEVAPESIVNEVPVVTTSTPSETISKEQNKIQDVNPPIPKIQNVVGIGSSGEPINTETIEKLETNEKVCNDNTPNEVISRNEAVFYYTCNRDTDEGGVCQYMSNVLKDFREVTSHPNDEEHPCYVHKGNILRVRDGRGASLPRTASNPVQDTPARATDLRPWQCGLCKFKSVLRPVIIEHCDKYHKSIMQYKCLYCDLWAINIEIISKHRSKKHPGEEAEVFYCYYREGSVPDEADGTARWQKQSQKIESHKNTETAVPPLQPVHQVVQAGLYYDIYYDIVKEEVDEPDTTEDNVNDLCDAFGRFCDPKGLLYKCSLCKVIFADTKEAMQSHLYEELQYRKWGCALCSYKAFHEKGLQQHLQTEHNDSCDLRLNIRIHLHVDCRIEAWVNKLLDYQTATIDANKAKLSSSDLVKQKTVSTSDPGTSNTPVESPASATEPPSMSMAELAKQLGPFGVPNNMNYTCPKCNINDRAESVMRGHLEEEVNKIGWRCDMCDVTFNVYHDALSHCRNEHPDKLSSLVAATRDVGLRAAWVAAVLRVQKHKMNLMPDTDTPTPDIPTDTSHTNNETEKSLMFHCEEIIPTRDIICLVCEEAMSETESNNHFHNTARPQFSVKGDTVYRCWVCLTLHNTKNSFNAHHDQYHGSDEKKWSFYTLSDPKRVLSCSLCKLHFVNITQCRTHLQLRHGFKEHMPIVPHVPDVVSQLDDEVKGGKRKAEDVAILPPPKRGLVYQ